MLRRKLILITDDEWDSSDLRQADGPGYTTKGAVCAMLKKVKFAHYTESDFKFRHMKPWYRLSFDKMKTAQNITIIL